MSITVAHTDSTTAALNTEAQTAVDSRITTKLASRDRYQEGGSGGGPCMIAGSTTNAVASGLLDCTIAGGGHDTRENVIGAESTENVGTANSNLPTTSGTGASFATIGGGYDNVNNALAGTIAGGAHHKLETDSTHGTIGGGSLNSILANADYATIAGGTANTASGDSSVIAGGTTNTAPGLSSTVGGGSTNTASGQTSTVGGGTLNEASATGATVGGGTNNEAKQTNSTIPGGHSNVVTSGSFATIGGGFTNDVGASTNADYATIAGGRENSAQADYVAIGGGQTHEVTGAHGSVGGGLSNDVSGQYGHIPGGHANTVTADKAEAGGEFALARLEGGHTRASGRFSALGDAQSTVLVGRCGTTSGTAQNIRLDGSIVKIVIPDQTTWCFVAYVVARRTDADDESAAYKIEGCMDRNTGSASAGLVGTPTVTVIAEDTSAWDVAVSESSGALEIACTGEADKDINWVARVTLVEVTG